MLRPILMSATAITLLIGCQMQDPGGQTTTTEDRLQISQEIIQNCEASRCQLLDLDSKLVNDYAQIAGLTHVTSLMASYSDFDDLADIAPMTQLTELHLGQTQLTDLSGLSAFSSLKLLHFQGNFQTNDLSPIGGLRNLEELAVGRNDLGDAAFLRNLRRLKTLSLSGADLTSLSALRGHPTLEVLDISEMSAPADLSVLQTIPNLRVVMIDDFSLSDEQKAVLDTLTANGVDVQFSMVMIVC